MELIVIAFIFAIASALIAQSRGDGAGVAFFLGLLLGPIGLLLVLFFVGGNTRCPHCRSRIHKKATVCPKCQRDLPDVGVVAPGAARRKPDPDANREFIDEIQTKPFVSEVGELIREHGMVEAARRLGVSEMYLKDLVDKYKISTAQAVDDGRIISEISSHPTAGYVQSLVAEKGTGIAADELGISSYKLQKLIEQYNLSY